MLITADEINSYPKANKFCNDISTDHIEKLYNFVSLKIRIFKHFQTILKEKRDTQIDLLTVILIHI